MATATTIESYFVGAQQFEVTLNGLGERAGNCNLYEAALALECNGVKTGLKLRRFYEIAIKVAGLSGVPIPEKAPLIGSDCLMQRSGIHQHGAVQTFKRAKGAYRAFDPSVIGRAKDEELQFTSQSGTAAVESIIRETGRDISKEDARMLQPALKLVSEGRGVLTPQDLACAYDALKTLQTHKSDLSQEDVNAVVRDAIGLLGEHIWQCRHVCALAGVAVPTASVVLVFQGQELPAVSAIGNGPVDAVYQAISKATGLDVCVGDYRINNVSGGTNAQALASCTLTLKGKQCAGKGVDTDTVMASVKAYMQALNRLARGENNGI